MGELFDMSSKIGEDLRARTRLKSDIEQRLRDAAEQKRQANVFGYQKNYSPVSDEKGNITSYTPNEKEAKNQYNKIRQYSEGGDLGRMPLLDEKIPVDNFGDSPISTEEMKLFKAKSDAAVAAKNNQGGQINPVHAEIASHVDKTLAMPLVDKSNKGSLLQLMNNVATPKQDGMRVVGKNESGGNILSPEKTKEELPGAEINVPLKPAPPLGFGDLNAMEQIQKTALDPSIQEKMIDLAQLPAEMKAELGLPEQGRIPNQIFNAILGRDAKLKSKKDDTLSPAYANALAMAANPSSNINEILKGLPTASSKAEVDALRHIGSLSHMGRTEQLALRRMEMQDKKFNQPTEREAKFMTDARNYIDILDSVKEKVDSGVIKPSYLNQYVYDLDKEKNPLQDKIVQAGISNGLISPEAVEAIRELKKGIGFHMGLYERPSKYMAYLAKQAAVNIADPKSFAATYRGLRAEIEKEVKNKQHTFVNQKSGNIDEFFSLPKKSEFKKESSGVDQVKKENDRQNILGMKDHPNFGSAKRIFESKYGESL